MKLFVTEDDDFYAGHDEATVRQHIWEETGDDVGQLEELSPFDQWMRDDHGNRILMAELISLHIYHGGVFPFCVASATQ